MLERDNDNIDVTKVLYYVNKCIELFVFENSMISLFKTLEKIA